MKGTQESEVPAYHSSPATGSTEQEEWVEIWQEEMGEPQAFGDADNRSNQAAGTIVQEKLLEIWQEVLECDHISVEDDFVRLGGDSIQSIKVAARANRAGIKLTPNQIFNHQTIASIAAAVEVSGWADAEPGAVEGEALLTPGQHDFFKCEPVNPHHHNHSVRLSCRQKISLVALQKAFHHLLTHHDALRLRFETGPTGWRQKLVSPQGFAVPVDRIDLSQVAPDQVDAARRATTASVERGLNIVDGPLVRAALFDLGEAQPQQLLLVVHQLVADAVSLGILIEDLDRAYGQIVKDEPVALPAKTASYKRYARYLHENVGSEKAQEQLTYWRAFAQLTPPRLPRDEHVCSDTADILQAVEVCLDATTTSTLLNDVLADSPMRAGDLLLAALVESFATWTGERRLWIRYEDHSRQRCPDNLDISRTVGRIVDLFPVLLDVSGTSTLYEAVQQIQKQLDEVPLRGADFGPLRYLGDCRELDAIPEPEVRFSYLGQCDRDRRALAVFDVTAEDSSDNRASATRQHRLIEVECRVTDDCLKLRWTYSASTFLRSTIETVAERFNAIFHTIVKDTLAYRNAKPRAYTPADFPLAGLEQATLLKILNAVGSPHD